MCIVCLHRTKNLGVKLRIGRKTGCRSKIRRKALLHNIPRLDLPHFYLAAGNSRGSCGQFPEAAKTHLHVFNVVIIKSDAVLRQKMLCEG